MGTRILLFLQVADKLDSVKHPHPALHAFGVSALEYADPQLITLAIIGFLVLLSLLGRLLSSRWATWEEVIKAGIALFTAVSGATIAVVFLLTNPPAFEKLSGESRWLPAAVTLAFTAKHGIDQIYTTFFKRK